MLMSVSGSMSLRVRRSLKKVKPPRLRLPQRQPPRFFFILLLLLIIISGAKVRTAFPATRLQKLHPGCSVLRKSTKEGGPRSTDGRFINAAKAGCKLPTHANERRGWDEQILEKVGKQMVSIEKLFLDVLHQSCTLVTKWSQPYKYAPCGDDASPP